MRSPPAPPSAKGPSLQLLALALIAATAAAPVVSLDDPEGDAYGPGSYLPPTSGEFTDGDFDLRRFAVLVDGDDVVFEVTLGAPVRRPQITHRANLSEVQLWNGIYLQNIDIYVDTDPASGAGQAVGLPGRRIAFADGRTWKRAVVLTPQPGPARGIVSDALGADAARVVFAEGLRSRGRTLIARVPAVALGGAPRPDWGWSVQVSGAIWDTSFAVLDRLRGNRELDLFTLPVLPIAESWAFGGAPEGQVHPRVIDVLLPPGVDQRDALGSFDVKAGTFARVPFVYPKSPPAQPAKASAAAAPPRSGVLTVADVSDNLVSISGPVGSLKPMQFGRVLGDDGRLVADLVITEVLKEGVVARPLIRREKIVPGERVVFDPAP